MWLGSSQQLAKVNVSEISVASARVNVSETARSLTLASSSTASWRCCAGVRRVSQLLLLPATAAPTARQIDVIWHRQDVGPGVHFMRPGLFQVTVLRHHRRSDKPAAVCSESECGCAFGVGRSMLWPHNATGGRGTALASGPALGGL